MLMLSTSGQVLFSPILNCKGRNGSWTKQRFYSLRSVMTCFLIYLIVGERIKKPVPLQEQTVKDAKGRYQRFHGAFTGGFSAGYFNTVGTKEGEILLCQLGGVA